MPARTKRPDALVGKVFRGRYAVATGLLTPRQLQGRAWRKLYHGVYADATIPLDHGLFTSAATGHARIGGRRRA
ncbi:MAG: hypothetical protein H0T66_09260 [Geodermatophilaceae bacterium]|nr:hypothetical protein [Geodermatophilaceae bacterium]MDQ3457543.1 hypothetical protein [Actinomycetota bacterium]